MLPFSRYLTSESPRDPAGKKRFIEDTKVNSINNIKNLLCIILIILLIFVSINNPETIKYTFFSAGIIYLYYILENFAANNVYEMNLNIVEKYGYDKWYADYYSKK